MDNLQKKFIEEASDNINDLEEALLLIETHPDDISLTERIFRALHTLKGTGAMFGFNSISELTHDLENIYDLIREGKKEITKEIITITLQSVDQLRRLLNDAGFSKVENIEAQKQLLKQINILLTNAPQVIDKHESVLSIPSTSNINTYYISFVPGEKLIKNGSNPLFILDELACIGKTIVYPHFDKIPDLMKIKPELCYLYFEIILSTNEGDNAISDVFIFVEDECKLEIQKLADFDIFENEDMIKKFIELKKNDRDFYLEGVQKILKTIRSRKANINGLSQNNKNENIISSIRVSSDKLDSLMNLVSELITTQARLALFSESNENPELLAISENVQKLSRQLRDIAFEIVLIPIETIITRYQRLVRDLSSELKKHVRFVTEGTDTELDKTIIENLSDPLLHIIRNSIDHGIELPEERKKKGKPEQGLIHFKSFYSGTNVIIEISDDGAGIDPEKIKNKAIKEGFIQNDTNIDKAGLFDLLFIPGFSTANKITDVSGRGVGMDVVKRKISEIRGDIKIESEVNKGTKLTITLPLTLSIIDGLLVTISSTHFIIPLSAVNKIYAVDDLIMQKAFNNQIQLDGMLYPFFNLRKELHITDNIPENGQLILLQYQDKQVGIIIDNVVGEYQAVLKPLGKHYKNQEMFSGASILGDGTVALVLDTNKLINNIAKITLKKEELQNG